MGEPVWKTAPTKAFKLIKPIVHVGFVPLVLYLAIRQDPDLSLGQLLNPFAAPPEPQMQ